MRKKKARQRKSKWPTLGNEKKDKETTTDSGDQSLYEDSDFSQLDWEDERN